jgi:anti-sigma-K factor RskA
VSTDIHTLTGAYSLNALTADEAAEFERHMKTCSACAQEVTELRETAARIGTAVAQTPPPWLRDRVLKAASQNRQNPPHPTRAHAWPRPRRAHWAAAAVAACIALAAVLGVQTARLQNAQQASQQAQTQYDRVTAVLTAPDARLATAHANGATGTVVTSSSRNSLVLLTTDLPALPAGRAYQAWLIGPHGPDSAGLIPQPAHPAVLTTPLKADANQVGITVEPAGGSPRPTSSALLLIPLS